jgi:hypothetical protein
MTRAPFRLLSGLLLSALLLSAARTDAKDADADPWPFLSTRADEPDDREPTAAVANLVVRPNQSAPFYAYVHNPGDQDWTNLRLVLAADAAGTDSIAEGTVARAPKGKTVAVKLALKRTVPQPPPAADKEKEKDKDKAGAKAPPPSAAPVPGTVYLLLFDGAAPANETPTPFRNPRAPAARTIRVAHPREYLTATAELRGPTADGLVLDVTVSASVPTTTDEKGTAVPFRGPPCRVSLDVRAGPDAPKAGTFESVLEPTGKAVVLRAEGLRVRPAGASVPDQFFVSADGFDRAFWFRTDLRTAGNALAPVTDRRFLAIGVAPFAIPGKPLPVRIEVAGVEPVGEPNLLFHRATTGAAERLSAGFSGPRDVRLNARVGSAGEFVVGTEVRDWVVPVDTTGVVGTRRFTLGVGTAEAEATITLDPSGPTGLRFHRLPATAVRGRPLAITAEGVDPESGIARVVFYVGEPPADGKPLPPGKSAVGVRGSVSSAKPDAGAPGAGRVSAPSTVNRPAAYTAPLLMPDQKGPVTVGARFTNRVGLTEEVVAEVLLVDPPTTGSIKGVVNQGSTPPRPQPGLAVVLVEDGAKPDAPPVATTKTNDKGEFELKGIKPGKYVVRTTKPSDYNAKAEQQVTVEASEKPVEVPLALKR